MKLSLCITTYNRPELTIQAFEKVYTDPRIDEIVIVDDKSTTANFSKLYDLLIDLSGSVSNECRNKWNLYMNDKNIGMSRNKTRAIEWAKNPWCILLDSDNVIDQTYLDALEKSPLTLQPDVIYCPVFAKPNFDYRIYANELFYAEHAKKEIQSDVFNMAMNTCNYVVNRDWYLKTYMHNEKHVASDTIWFNYNWLKDKGGFYFVPGMEYFHRVHKDSGFMQNAAYNMQQSNEVRKLIAAL